MRAWASWISVGLCAALQLPPRMVQLPPPHPTVSRRNAEAPSQPELHKHAAAALISAVIFATSAFPAFANAPSVLAGRARVVDGDTLVVEGQRIRLYGVDAPESAQQCLDANGKSYPCGLVSKDALDKLVGNNPVRCAVKSQDQYGRNVAVCSLGGGLDLNGWLASNGYAVSYRQAGIWAFITHHHP